MKNIFTAILIAYSAIISGQSLDKMKVDTVVYLTDEQEAFMIDKETKYLFKTGPLGYERKLSESFSINTVFQPSYSRGLGLNIEGGLELRYYYKMSRLLKEGKQANNLSSEYFSAGVDYDGGLPFADYYLRSFNYNISWGSQKRFLNNGYFDFGVSLGYSDVLYNTSRLGVPNFEAQAIVLSTKTAVGYAFGKNYQIDDVVKCPIFKCHLDRKSALKFNFNKVLRISYGTNSKINENRFTATLNPNIAYEHKIGSSSFSIDQDLDFLIGFSSKVSNVNTDAGVSQYRLGYTATVRHYYQLKSNIRKGKSGNNLSGNYWFAGASFQYGDSKLPFLDEDQDFEVGKHKYFQFPIGLGYQETILNDYYFDFQFGLNLRFREIITPNDPVLKDNDVALNFKVGKLF